MVEYIVHKYIVYKYIVYSLSFGTQSLFDSILLFLASVSCQFPSPNQRSWQASVF